MAHKTLIVKLGAIGDVVSVLPAAWSMYQSGSQIDWLCGRAVEPLLSCYTWVRPIAVNDALLLGSNLTDRIREVLRTWAKLAGSPYDLCAILQYDRRYRILTAPVRARRAIMLKRGVRDLELVSERHHSAEYTRIMCGLPDGYHAESVAPVKPDVPLVNPFPRNGKVRIALVPGGARNLLRDDPQRRWPLNLYSALAKQLLEAGYEVILSGGPDDRWVESEFSGLQTENRVGQWTIPQTLAFYDSCDCVVAHDTGPLHLAGLTRCGLVGLFGPTAPSKVLPRRNGVIGIWGGERLTCRPCYNGNNYAECNWNGCMASISTERVSAEIQSLLQHPDTPWRIEHL